MKVYERGYSGGMWKDAIEKEQTKGKKKIYEVIAATKAMDIVDSSEPPPCGKNL